MDGSPTPYGEVFSPLVQSVMRAQAEVIRTVSGGVSDALLLDALINRHFSWLCAVYPDGINSHLFKTLDDAHSLRTDALYDLQALPEDIRQAMNDRGALPLEPIEWVQDKPTRISQLVKHSLALFDDIAALGRMWDASVEKKPAPEFCIRSPLSVAFNFLTIPEMPGSRAYALLTLRNFLFETFGVVPNNSSSHEGDWQSFEVSDIERAHFNIQAALRVRGVSDAVQLRSFAARSAAEDVLNHFLSAQGLLWQAFDNRTDAESFLSNACVPSQAGDGLTLGNGDPYRFSLPPALERLPELGEIVNALWGLPIPIRGADTLFRGGLKFSAEGGLVVALHGGPGTGKTTVALSLGALLAPFGVKTLFITAEEGERDLREKAKMLLTSEIRQLSFSPSEDWLYLQRLDDDEDQKKGRHRYMDAVSETFETITKALASQHESAGIDLDGIPKTCRAIIVLDGVHDLIMSASDYNEKHPLAQAMRSAIALYRKSKALVIITTGEDWEGQPALDYLVDVAIRLSLENVDVYGRKPDRMITISKARHQLCAAGAHGLQISGVKGVRFSPQINYQLDHKALWKTPLPDMRAGKTSMGIALSRYSYEQIYVSRYSTFEQNRGFEQQEDAPILFSGANIFLNGEGSGGKAALALKIAISPSFELTGKPSRLRSGDLFTHVGRRIDRPERILVISFLYPSGYYRNVLSKLLEVRWREYGIKKHQLRPEIKVVHLYPGNYRADQLFNRVEWELDAAELQGVPYSCVVIDGLHNIYLQFPEIEAYTLFWAQFFAALRARAVTVISTHTTFLMQGGGEESYRLDDKRSEPLRHALIQKTDFTFEIDPYLERRKTSSQKRTRSVSEGDAYQEREGSVFEKAKGTSASNIFGVRVLSAINQPIPKQELLWSREHLVLFKNEESWEHPQHELSFKP